MYVFDVLMYFFCDVHIGVQGVRNQHTKMYSPEARYMGTEVTNE
jgi:hypothetical protein